MFIFARCLRSLAAVTPAKYELDIIPLTTVLIIRKKWENNGTEKIGLVTPPRSPIARSPASTSSSTKDPIVHDFWQCAACTDFVTTSCRSTAIKRVNDWYLWNNSLPWRHCTFWVGQTGFFVYLFKHVGQKYNIYVVWSHVKYKNKDISILCIHYSEILFSKLNEHLGDKMVNVC